MEKECKKQIIIVKGKLDPLRVFCDALGKGFELIGYNIFYIDLLGRICLEEFSTFVNKPVLGCICFNNQNAVLAQTEIGRIIFEEMNIPGINILVDNPVYYIKELLTTKNDVVITIDKGHMKYVADNFSNIPIAAFLPHGGRKYDELNKCIDINERKIDILYAGSLHVVKNNYELSRIQALQDYGFDYEDFNISVLNRMYETPSRGFFEIINDLLLEKDIVIDYEKRQMLYYNLVNCERVVCSSFREALLLALAKSGLNITLCGGNWEKCDEIISLPNVNYLGSIPAEDVLKIMGDSKIVLNHMTWFKDGAHERIFNGMLAGSVVVSDSSKYLKDELVCQDIFDDSNDVATQLFTYELGNEERLPQYIKRLLSDEKRMEQVAGCGRVEAESKHTWAHRAKEIDEALFCN